MAENKLTPEEKAEKERLNAQHLHSLRIQAIKRMERELYGSKTTLEIKSGGRNTNKNN